MTMAKPWEIYAWLWVTDGQGYPNLDPERLTAELGLSPTEVWRVGQPFGLRNRIATVNRWALESEIDRTATPDEHASSILERLSQDWPKATRILSQFMAGLTIPIKIYGSRTPPIQLESATVRKLAELGASLDVDLYYLPEPEFSESGECVHCGFTDVSGSLQRMD